MSERFDFDQLARDLAGGLSRREALRRLGGALAAALLASLGLERRAFGAPAVNSQCQPFCRTTCGIHPGGGNAFGQCVSSCEGCLNSSGSVCACPPTGSVAVVCASPGQGCCGASFCPAGQYCCDGQCSLCPCSQTVCAGGHGTSCCTAGQTCCDGACVNAQSDPFNCGGCGRSCPGGQSCVSGHCQSNCAPGQTLCGNACVDTSSDTSNCGNCGHTCPTPAHAMPVCASGLCSYACLPGYADCNQQASDGCEVNTTSDAHNCGFCGHTCAAGESCVNSACTCGSSGDCLNGKLCCGGVCTDVTSDVNNCGGCGQACPSGHSCVNGQCATGCAAGLTLCGAACVDTQTDPQHCGGCNSLCLMGGVCAGGSCTCPSGWTVCDSPIGLACVNLQSDANNCGACGYVCPSGESCVSGRCTCGSGGNCPSLTTCCGGSCVDFLHDNNNCGKCGSVCGGISFCENGICSLGCAAPGQGCRGDSDCCSPGQCVHNTCLLPTGSPCAGSSDCQILYCTLQIETTGNVSICCMPPGSYTCHSNMDCCPPAACSLDGICLLPTGSPCTSTDQCQSGKCTNGGCCPYGQSYCPRAGCVDWSTDPANCGGCGITCRPGVACVAGNCGLAPIG